MEWRGIPLLSEEPLLSEDRLLSAEDDDDEQRLRQFLQNRQERLQNAPDPYFPERSEVSRQVRMEESQGPVEPLSSQDQLLPAGDDNDDDDEQRFREWFQQYSQNRRERLQSDPDAYFAERLEVLRQVRMEESQGSVEPNLLSQPESE